MNNAWLYEEYQYHIFSHFVYLLLSAIMNFYLLYVIYKYVSRDEIKQRQVNMDFDPRDFYTPKIIKRVSIFLFLISIILLYIGYIADIIAILREGGSDSIMYLAEQFKTVIWLYYSTLGVLSSLLLLISFYTPTIYKWIALILSALISLTSGKKSALLGFMSDYLFLYLIINKKRYGLKALKFMSVRKSSIFIYKKNFYKIVLIFIFFAISIVFAIFTLLRTLNIGFNVDEFLNLFRIFFDFYNLAYISSTLYLSQLFEYRGIELSSVYSEHLGNFGVFKYFLNPFTKFLFGIGIERGIGNFLVNRLFGYETAHGVNPTLFFEFYFIFDNLILSTFYSAFTLVLIFLLQRRIIIEILNNSRIIYPKKFEDLLYFLILILLLKFSLGFKYDTLNNIRNLLPFISIVYLIYRFRVISFLSRFRVLF